MIAKKSAKMATLLFKNVTFLGIKSASQRLLKSKQETRLCLRRRENESVNLGGIGTKLLGIRLFNVLFTLEKRFLLAFLRLFELYLVHRLV